MTLSSFATFSPSDRSLSVYQERLWLAQQRAWPQPVYHLLLMLPLGSPWDRRALEQALQQEIDRHPSLRTYFPLIRGQAQPVVLPPWTVTLANLTGEGCEGAPFWEWPAVRSLLDPPFDLGQAPPWRSGVVQGATAAIAPNPDRDPNPDPGKTRLPIEAYTPSVEEPSPSEAVFVMVLHGMVADEGSVAVLRRELAAAYGALAGQPIAGIADAGIAEARIANAGILDAGIAEAGIADAEIIDAEITEAGKPAIGEPAPEIAASGPARSIKPTADKPIVAQLAAEGWTLHQSSPQPNLADTAAPTAPPDPSADLQFWLQQLQDAPLLLEFPSDRPRPAQPRFQRCLAPFQWDSSLRQSLASLASQHACDLESVLLAAFLAFLHRYSDQPDCVIGYPQDQWHKPWLNQRPHPWPHSSADSSPRPVGPGTEILALRSRSLDPQYPESPEKTLTFLQLLAQTLETQAQITTRSSFPLEALLNHLKISPSSSYTPWYQILFRYCLSPAAADPGSALPSAQLWPCSLHHSPFDLTLSFCDRGEHLQGFLEYNPDLMDPETITSLLEQFQTLAQHIATQPQTPIAQLPLLTPAQLTDWLHRWNPIATPYSEGSVVELIAAQAQRSPAAIAVIAGEFEANTGADLGPSPASITGPTTGPTAAQVAAPDRKIPAIQDQTSHKTLTYGDLMQRSAQIASFLQQQGIGAGQRVGLALGRSIDLPIAVLGVLRSGAAYVPLDPSYPADRLQFMATDAALSLILIDDPAAAQPYQSQSFNIVEIEQIFKQNREIPALPPLPTSTDLAYLIYTSGSTGKPKGVAIRHGSLVNFLEAMQQHLHLTPQDTWLALTTLSFDIAALELLLPLLVGATVAIAPQASQRDAFLLAQVIDQTQANIIQATPTTWQLLRLAQWQGWGMVPDITTDLSQQQSLQPQNPARSRPQLLCGGEALTPTIARFLLDAAGPQGTVWNLYGPTETTIWSLIQPVTPDLLHRYDRAPSLPIGLPLANTQVYILNSAQQPCLPGQAGEIYLGGDGLAQGYWQRPQLSADRFPSLRLDPPTPQPQRLYRTGDRGRWHRDGRLEFLGRVDYQVKLRGHRLELGEVEQALGQHPQIDRAVVQLWEPPLVQNAALVAYGLAKQGENTPSAAEIRQFLRQSLPDYMIPSAFVLLPDLPRTANGKVDRRALPLPDSLQAPARLAGSSDLGGTVATATAARPAVLGSAPVPIPVLAEDHPNPSLGTLLRSPAGQILIQTWQNYLQIDSLGPDSHFLDLGGNSLVAMAMTVALSPHFPHLRLGHLFQYPTLGQLAQFLATATPSAPALSTAVLHQGDRPIPLFVVNAIGQFRNLVNHLDPRQTVYGLSIFGLDMAHPGDTTPLTLQTFAQALIQQIQSLQPHGPYALGAYCADTCVIWEIAQQLQQAGEKVAFLGFIDTIWLPRASDFGLVANLKVLQAYGWDYFHYRLQRRQGTAPRRRSWLPLRSQGQSRLALTPGEPDPLPPPALVPDADPNALSHDRWLYGQFLAATDRYHPQPYPGPVTLFLSKEYRLKRNRLADFVQGSFQTVPIDSYHHNMFQMPQILSFGQQFQAQLNQALDLTEDCA